MLVTQDEMISNTSNMIMGFTDTSIKSNIYDTKGHKENGHTIVSDHHKGCVHQQTHGSGMTNINNRIQ